MGLESLVILLISHLLYLILFFLMFKNKTSLCINFLVILLIPSSSFFSLHFVRDQTEKD